MAYTRKRSPITGRITFDDVALNFTFACNLSCVGCDRASFIKPQHSPPMSKERLGSFLDEIRSSGVELRRMRIVGGEPTLHPDFLEMVGLCMKYAEETEHRCNVRIFSNRHSQNSRYLLAFCAETWPRLQQLGVLKQQSAVFPKMTRFEYVSPIDAGIDCPHPCPNMACRGKCGAGVDNMGIFMCPTGGPIDSILDLGAGAKTVQQMLDQEFVLWQSRTICAHCGQFMAYQDHELPRLWKCNGTPVSKEYHDKLAAKGFMT